MIKEQIVPVDPGSGEPSHLPDDNFLEMLPVMLSPKKPAAKEPEFEDLATETRDFYSWQATHRAQLVEQGRYATGSKIAIFASEIGAYEVDEPVVEGEEPRFHYEYEVSTNEYAEHLQAAKGVEHQIKQKVGQSAEVETRLATKEAISQALADESIGHIIFIGHASSGRLTTSVDDDKDFMWHDPQEPVDHLKLSFGVFGCGVPGLSGITPRVGLGFVAPEGIMYGVPTGYLEEGTLYQFDQLVRLPSKDLVGTPDYQAPAPTTKQA